MPAKPASVSVTPLQLADLDLIYAMSRQLVSHLTLPDVLAGVLRVTASATEADTASIALLDDRGQLMEALLLVGDRLVDDARNQLRPMLTRGLLGQGMRERRSLRVENTRTDPRWATSVSDDDTARSAVAVPIVREEQLIGAFILTKNSPGHFNADHERLLVAIADLASVAITNARLFAESRRQTETMAALAETSRIINSTLDPRQVIEYLLDRTVAMIGADAASIALISPDGRTLRFEAAVGAAAAVVVGTQLRLGQGIAGWVAQTGRAVLIGNAQADERFFPGVDLASGFHTQAMLCAPVQAKGVTLGVVQVINPARGFFDDNDLQLLTNVANLAGNALAHAQEYTLTQVERVHYAGVFEDSANGTLLTNLDGRVVDANRRMLQMLNYTRLELLDKSILALHALKGDLLHQLANGDELTFETSILTRDQRVLPVEVTAKRIEIDPETSVIQWVERDITERRQVESIRNDLTAMLFHDLRSPLGNIISSLELLRSVTEDDNTAHAILDVALRSSRRLSRLVDSLLDVNRLQSGNVTLQRETTDIRPLLEDAVEQLRLLATSKEIDLQLTDYDDAIPPLSVDADMLRRVFINLTENGVKYTRAGGLVHVRAVLNGDVVQVEVRDTGVGIPKHEQTNIFTKFTRVRREKNTRGLGLGLTFCKLAVEAHGGKIGVTSVEGEGSTFTVTLPISPPGDA